jgi:hypothetical protein
MREQANQPSKPISYFSSEQEYRASTQQGEDRVAATFLL